MNVLSILRQMAADVRGATAIEYGLILALLFLAIIGGVSFFATSVISMYGRVSTTTSAAVHGNP